MGPRSFKRCPPCAGPFGRLLRSPGFWRGSAAGPVGRRDAAPSSVCDRALGKAPELDLYLSDAATSVNRDLAEAASARFQWC